MTPPLKKWTAIGTKRNRHSDYNTISSAPDTKKLSTGCDLAKLYHRATQRSTKLHRGLYLFVVLYEITSREWP